MDMPQALHWEQHYCIGHSVIDLQHAQLFSLYNALLASFIDNSNGAESTQALHQLIDYCEQHFADEERLMREHQYPDLEEHQRSHQKLAQHIGQLITEQQQAGYTLSYQVVGFLRKWIIHHVMSESTSLSGL